MKKKMYLLFALLLSVGLTCCSDDNDVETPSPGPVITDELPFVEDMTAAVKDENFKKYILEELKEGGSLAQYDTKAPFGVLSSDEIALVKELDLDGDEKTRYSNLAGLEYFVGLEILDISDNPEISEVNISHLVNLKELKIRNNKIRNNKLVNLDISKNTKLERLFCDYNSLTSLDVSKNTKLNYLDCSSNNLTSIDVSSIVDLEYLICLDNKLVDIDLTKNTGLVILMCENNKLVKLDVSKNTKLQALVCLDNNLTSLDVSKNVKLQTLHCSSNDLTNLDVNKNIELSLFVCESNPLTSLDISNNKSIENLSILHTNIKELDVSNNMKLHILTADEALEKLYVWENYVLRPNWRLSLTTQVVAK